MDNAGEGFVIMGKNGSSSEVDMIEGVRGSFFGAPMLKQANTSFACCWLKTDFHVDEYAGERFVIMGKNCSTSEVDLLDSILGSFFGAPMLKTGQYWPRPCTVSTSGYPNFQPR